MESFKVQIDGEYVGDMTVSSDFDMISFDLGVVSLPYPIYLVAAELWRCVHGGGEFMPSLEAATAELFSRPEKRQPEGGEDE